MMKTKRNSVSISYHSAISVSTVSQNKNKKVARGSATPLGAKKKTSFTKILHTDNTLESENDNQSVLLPTVCSTENSSGSPAKTHSLPIQTTIEELTITRTSSKDFINRGLYLKSTEEVNVDEKDVNVRLLNALQIGFLVISKVKSEIDVPLKTCQKVTKDKFVKISAKEKKQVLHDIQQGYKLRVKNYDDFFSVLKESLIVINEFLRVDNQNSGLKGITLVETERRGLRGRMSTIIEEIENCSSFDMTSLKKQDSLISNLQSLSESISEAMSFASKSSSEESIIVIF